MSAIIHHSAKRINRADLIRALRSEDDDLLSVTAEMCGFKPPKKAKVAVQIPELEFTPADGGERVATERPSTAPEPAEQPRFQPHYYRVIKHKQSEILPETSDGEEKPKPQWLRETPRFDPSKVVPLKVTPPEKEPLVAWTKLWPVLRSLLSEQARTRQPDMPQIVKTIANGHWLEQIPRKTRRRWTANVYILVDRPSRTSLFNQDYNRLLEQLKQLRGTTGLVLQRILRQPGGRVRQESGKQQQVQDWQVPAAGSTVFILSDLGLLDESGVAQRVWLKVGKQLQLAGCRPVVLLPLPARYLSAELVALFDCISWHRNSLLRTVSYVQPSMANQPTAQQQDRETVEDLLAWLSPAVRVEPSLLRAIRHQLPRQHADVGHEALAWHHEDVERSAISFHYQPKSIEKYRERFLRLKGQEGNRDLAIRIARLIIQYHRHVFPTQRYEELLLLQELLGEDVPADAQELVDAQQHMRELVKAGWDQTDEIPGIQAFLLHQLERQHQSMIRNHDFYQVVWGYKHYELGEPDGADLPEGFDPQNVLACVGERQSERREYVLFQQGAKALQLGTRERYLGGSGDGFVQGGELTNFSTPSTLMLRQHWDADGKLSNQVLALGDEQTLAFPLEEKEIQQLHVAGQELTVERFVKPEWAIEIGQTREGLYADSVNKDGEVFRWYWWPAVSDGVVNKRGFWFYESPNSFKRDGKFWEDDTGVDEYGLYADAEIAGVTQRFRWIEPTTFLMGSPKDEEDREDDEIQHKVTLTKGYWLADTTCTQILWEIIMGNNPSEFKAGIKPVENISWNDIQRFLRAVNNHNPELKLRLPTEAEWENACRAGADTPFHFGGREKLNLGRVNYSGTWDNKSSDGKTQPVKSYLSNPWGLDEMHGNVWEWCQDRYGPYQYQSPDKASTDPIEERIGGNNRVLRGGAWPNAGKYCRSAFRHYGNSGSANAFAFYGFRLARSHDAKPVRAISIKNSNL